jgi:septum formation protein
MIDFYLASGSPRRSDLLRQVGARFEVLRMREAPPRGPDVLEVPHRGETGAEYVRRVAFAKAAAGRRFVRARALAPLPVLAADTEVVQDDEIFGKPRHRDDAERMLRRLCGREHEVVTVVALARPAAPDRPDPHVDAEMSITRVRLRELSDEEIARYCDSGEPMGKAGGYALQGLAGAFVEHIEGSCSGVVGLALAPAARLLALAGIRVP